MASIFTFDPSPARVSSPWSTPRNSTPQPGDAGASTHQPSSGASSRSQVTPNFLPQISLTKLDPEPQEGSTEYKLHLLLRPRRNFISSSTGVQVSGSQHSMQSFLGSAVRSDNSLSSTRMAQAPTNQTRQSRLQQLTTQLLWRLQQSSPFHSSSTANLVLPVLPEATPKLGIPRRPAKLLPGLEESQGALYEIGVADDGTLVGLIEDEMDESLSNLKAMAASLGCTVEVLRKVVVGNCEWTDSSSDQMQTTVNAEELWVAEALVRPDLTSHIQSKHLTSYTPSSEGSNQNYVAGGEIEAVQSRTEQLRVSLTGTSTAGKSSLLGTLSTSTYDNGRGKSRLSLLKHRHEIASGVTSSVAQELIGYSLSHKGTDSLQTPHDSPEVINYASGNVSSWNDIHIGSGRLVFLSDSPGLPRFSKSTIRTLISWDPHWTIHCVAADNDDDGSGSHIAFRQSQYLSTPSSSAPTGSVQGNNEPPPSHLELCLKLKLPLLVAITKMDIATKSGLRQTLATVLSAIKAAGKRPLLLRAAPVRAEKEVETQIQSFGDHSTDVTRISSSDEAEAQKAITMLRDDDGDVVPIVLTSAVTGMGIGQLHALLRSLPFGNTNKHTSMATPHPVPPREECTPSQIFHIDEVFAMLPSRVYSPSSRDKDEASHGVVLCGHVISGVLSVGDELELGPFVSDIPDEGLSLSGSANPQSSYTSGEGVNSALALQSWTPPRDSLGLRPTGSTRITFVPVQIVSIRNLRLPVRALLPDQAGTVGVELVLDHNGQHNAKFNTTLNRARKGMVLLSRSPSPTAHRTFVASFPSTDFASPDSPPLILGGHAIVYFNSVRAAVKVTAVAIEDTSNPSSPVADLFEFDGDDCVSTFDGAAAVAAGRSEEHAGEADSSPKEIKITFRFVSTVEWMQPGDRVLVVPNASAAGPVTGPAIASGGLSGFVGRVCDGFS